MTAAISSCCNFAVTSSELERIQEAYKRACGFAGIMKETVFLRDVLGDSVPIKLSQVCGIFCTNISLSCHFILMHINI